jgi:DnaJ-class molecular chaperone
MNTTVREREQKDAIDALNASIDEAFAAGLSASDITVAVNEAITCPVCHGDGEVTFNQSIRNDPQMEQTGRCDECRGTGTRRPSE